MASPARACERIAHPARLSERLKTAAAVLAGLATVAILFSIAISQILLGAALLALLLSRRPLRFPRRFGAALLAFLVWTLLSLAFSGAPWDGLSQVRKLYVFFAFAVAYNAYQSPRQLWKTVRGAVLGGAIAACYGLAQFVLDYWTLSRQGLPFYENYVVHQITGFMGHWLTFSGQLMMVLLLAVSLFFFGDLSGKMRLGIGLCASVLALGLLAAFTRGIWLGTFCGLVYLVARSEKRRLWLAPLALVLLYIASPAWLQQRSRSIFDLQTDTSNQARVVMAATGLKMIAAHPWFGVGPERVAAEFLPSMPEGMSLPPGWYGHLHNDYLQFAAERGIPCLLFWLWMLFEVFYANLSIARLHPGTAHALSHSAIAITIGLMVSGLFEFNFGDSEVLMLYLFLIAAPLAWARLAERTSPAPANPQPIPASLPGSSAVPQPS